MKLGSQRCTIFISFYVLILMMNNVAAESLIDFTSDGCSHFPDGTLKQPNLWCDCCINHDIAYWQGGTRFKKEQADQALRACVFKKTGNVLLADAMYYAVSFGGSPVFPMWYRWGYGWHYGRGFQSLNEYENQKVDDKLLHYRKSLPFLSCDFEYPIKKEIKEKFKWLVDE